MKRFHPIKSKIKTAGILFSLLIPGLFFPGLPWSAYCQHKLKKIVIKTEIKISKWQGYQPRLVSIVGDADLPGARVQALYSPSGWATLCDFEGKFTLSDVLWYPGATYDLVFSTDEATGKVVQVNAPSTYPASGFMDVGRLALQSEPQVNVKKIFGDTSCSYENFDLQNRDYYRHIFDKLTVGMTSDEEKVEAINNYIAQRLNYQETQWQIGSPRRIIERGSQYCGHLGETMATILAVAYPIRVIHLKDTAAPANTHAVVEVFYDKQWHMYDPTFGVIFKNKQGKVLSYTELWLNPGLVSLDLFFNYRQKYPKISLHSLPNVYASGHHHYYYLAYPSKQYAHAWWVYKGGVGYVSYGDSILLAAAGIRAGSKVIYRIRKSASEEDELVIISRHGATSGNVLNEEESPAIHLAPGFYDVFVDLLDGNISKPNNDSPAFITNWHLGVKLEVR